MPGLHLAISHGCYESIRIGYCLYYRSFYETTSYPHPQKTRHI